ncbi:hypothetical protein JMUB7542_28130 [Staphylococcus aureus]
MSASLVGSEMCIRDSYKEITFQPTNHQLNQFCLLYTSDAADEGLGVDLGGRRIIKKHI